MNHRRLCSAALAALGLIYAGALRAQADSTAYPAKPVRMIIPLQTSTARALAMPALIKRLDARGLQAHGSTSSNFDRYLKQEMIRWAGVVKSVDIRGD
ncbi:MAG: hypothetical protein GEV05_09870 [Betaproteobacteria bacterium]|nr:hypothetical protein [Betaproteobacteria bacterium]